MRGLNPNDERYALTTHLARLFCHKCEGLTLHVKLSDADHPWACIGCDLREIERVVQNTMNVPDDNRIRDTALKIVDQVNHFVTRHSARGPCFDDLVSFADALASHFPR